MLHIIESGSKIHIFPTLNLKIGLDKFSEIVIKSMAFFAKCYNVCPDSPLHFQRYIHPITGRVIAMS